jgi:putative serine protease PepD
MLADNTPAPASKGMWALMDLTRSHPRSVPARTKLAARLGLGGVILAMAVVASGCGADDAKTVPLAATPSPGLQSTFTATVHKVLPSVVEIRTSRGLGSGIVFDNAGDIVTNDHVVGNARTFSVLVNGSKTPLAGTLVGTYPASDLAVIKVKATAPLTPATFADSATLQVGDVVLAMGNPLGLEGSVSEGIVSATGRKVAEGRGDGSPGADLKDVIQTSAAINPGNSGGALVNLQGEVVGVPTLTATDPQIGGTAPGIGFAIPSSSVSSVARQLISSGHVTDPPQ